MFSMLLPSRNCLLLLPALPEGWVVDLRSLFLIPVSAAIITPGIVAFTPHTTSKQLNYTSIDATKCSCSWWEMPWWNKCNISNNCGMWSCPTLAQYPGPFEKSEKRTWYPLFAHALNFPTFWEFQIIQWYLRVPWHLLADSLCTIP